MTTIMNNTNTLEMEASKLARMMRPKYDGERSEAEIAATAAELAQTVRKYALGSATAAIGSVWLPGVGSTLSTVAAAGFIWTMYFQINKCLGIEFSKAALKTLASAVLSNLTQSAAAVAGTIVVASVLSLTGIGAVPATVMIAALDYAIVSVGGVIYLKLLNGLMGEGRNIEEMQVEEVIEKTDTIIHAENIREMLKAEAGKYKDGRKKGSISGNETAEVID